MNFTDRIVRGWNAFMNKDPTRWDYGATYSRNPSRPRFSHGNERSIANAVYNRISVDCTAIEIKHCRMDKDDKSRYKEDINSGLTND